MYWFLPSCLMLIVMCLAIVKLSHTHMLTKIKLKTWRLYFYQNQWFIINFMMIIISPLNFSSIYFLANKIDVSIFIDRHHVYFHLTKKIGPENGFSTEKKYCQTSLRENEIPKCCLKAALYKLKILIFIYSSTQPSSDCVNGMNWLIQESM